MGIDEVLSVTSRQDWRRWLAQHHQSEKEVWLVFFKKSSSKQAISYEETVEEAICYGWVDVQQKSIDGERYALRFTPRRKQSSWGKSNHQRALKMLREGRMTEAGMAVLPTDVLKQWNETGTGGAGVLS